MANKKTPRLEVDYTANPEDNHADEHFEIRFYRDGELIQLAKVDYSDFRNVLEYVLDDGEVMGVFKI